MEFMLKCLKHRHSIINSHSIAKFWVVLCADIGYNKRNLKCTITPVVLNLQIL